MHIEVELAFEVMRTELSKVCFIPDDDIRPANTVEAGPTREEGVENWRYVFEVLEDELALMAGRYVRICYDNKRNKKGITGVGGRTTDVGGGGGNLLGRPPPRPP